MTSREREGARWLAGVWSRAPRDVSTLIKYSLRPVRSDPPAIDEDKVQRRVIYGWRVDDFQTFVDQHNHRRDKWLSMRYCLAYLCIEAGLRVCFADYRNYIWLTRNFFSEDDAEIYPYGIAKVPDEVGLKALEQLVGLGPPQWLLVEPDAEIKVDG